MKTVPICAPEGAQKKLPEQAQAHTKRGVNKVTPLLYTRMREELLNLGSNELIALAMNVDNFN